MYNNCTCTRASILRRSTNVRNTNQSRATQGKAIMYKPCRYMRVSVWTLEASRAEVTHPNPTPARHIMATGGGGGAIRPCQPPDHLPHCLTQTDGFERELAPLSTSTSMLWPVICATAHVVVYLVLLLLSSASSAVRVMTYLTQERWPRHAAPPRPALL